MTSKMAAPTPVLAVRGSGGTTLLCGPPHCEEHATFQRDNRQSRHMVFSKDGSLFGWCNGDNVNVVKVSDGSVVSAFVLPKVALLEFSPLNSVLVTWQPYQGEPNLQLWDLHTGSNLKSLYQKKVDSWCPSWSDDEKIAVRSVNNELHFFEDNDFNTIANKIHMQSVSDIAVSPGGQPCKVALYVPGVKGSPSFVRLYQYPYFGVNAALANKSFFKGDRVSMLWNKNASALLVSTSTDVDKTGASYYGEQGLYNLAVNGETAVVQLRKNGPIYDVAWSPNSIEFCVVYGSMPAKATIFNLKCEPVFDFGTGPRNAIYYSHQGHLLVLAGFGNLSGQMEVWDVKTYKQVSKPQAPNCTYFSWCPDGEHVVTATCAPRLRVDNGYKIWHYSGSVVHRQDIPAGTELWQVLWQSFPEEVFPERPVKYQAARSDLGNIQAKPAQAYRPPALRNKPESASAKLHEEEPPQNMYTQPSKAALRNRKKREARSAARQETKPEAPEPLSKLTPVAANSQSAPATGDPETDKRIKNIKKKLRAIEELKELQVSGKDLQRNQVEKMQKEVQLLKELEGLALAD